MNPTPFITPVFSRFLGMAIRHIKYVVSTSRYVRKLQTKRDALDARKNDINDKIGEGERRSQRPTHEVLLWRKQADDMLGRIDDALKTDIVSCVCRICSRHKIGHSCAEMFEEVDELLGRTLSHNVDCDYSNTVIPMPPVVEDSQKAYFDEALKCIEDDNSTTNIISIWGPGGVGKTTLQKKIHNYFVETSSMFETVIWIEASSEQSNISRFQSEIAKNLRLKETESVHLQARQINRYLQNENFLLFIDDLWEHVELHEVGVPDREEGNQLGKKRKVIFTTRSREVCGKMKVGKIIEVKCLDPVQSWILFTENVHQEVVQSHPGIRKLAEEVVKECQGLPLALVTIGRAMCMKSNIGDWRHTLNQLKNLQGLPDVDADKRLLHRLKISYDNLPNDKLRDCFLSISLWPEDQMIRPEEIIEFWMGIDLIDIHNYESKYELYLFGHSLIGSLQALCLLEDVVDDGYYYSVKVVKMHDVLRDLALWLVSDCGENKNKWMVKGGIQLQKTSNMKTNWTKAECISFMGSNILQPSDIPSCPSLLTLLLPGNKLYLDLYGKSDLNWLGKFRSLTHLDLSNNRLESIPESICDLTKLRYLNLSNNEITDLPLKLGNLKALRYLILRNNWISNIPRGVFAELVELLVLDMFKAIDTTKYRAVDVEELKSMENKLLCFGTTVQTEEELSKLMLLSELPIDNLCIQCLHSTFHFMSMLRNAHRLTELCIERSDGGLMEIVFDKNETDQDTPLNLEFLHLDGLWGLKRIIWKDIAPGVLFAALRDVHIYNCSRLEDITWVINLPSLDCLTIMDCNDMKIAFSFDDDVDPQVLTLPSLLNFILKGMDKLEKISTHSLALPQLKHMRISNCPLLKTDDSRSHFNQFFNRRLV